MKKLLLFSLLLFAVPDLHAQQEYDARILNYRGLRFTCGDSLTPVLRIQNAGSQSMFTCVVETQLWRERPRSCG